MVETVFKGLMTLDREFLIVPIYKHILMRKNLTYLKKSVPFLSRITSNENY